MADEGKDNSVNPELLAERKKATFDVSELTTLIDQSTDVTEERKEVEKFLYDDPNIPHPFSLLGVSSEEYHKKVLATAKYVEKKISNVDLPGQIPGGTPYLYSSYIRYIAAPSESPILTHTALFVPTVLTQSTEEQAANWIPLIDNGKIIGSYAQTELGHGSDIKQLETTATYDENTEEFILHSPTITSIKCWPGALGRTANFAVIMAQLYTKGKCYGLHMFMVQLRDLESHAHVSGVKIGELGPKMGFLGADNGFLRLTNVRIPRLNMLMKHAQVLKDGTYVKPQHERSSYGTMVYIRMGVISNASLELGQACTIAIRYSAIRRQGVLTDGGSEVKILDYQTQQYKLFPQVATAYAIYFTFQKMVKMYIETMNNLIAEKLNEMHVLSCAMKAMSSHLGATGAEICRQACGGLGYLHASRIPMICALIQASCTYEGDNTIMKLQTAKYLIKSVKMMENGENIGVTVQYLKKKKDKGPSTCMTEFVNMFDTTTANMILEVDKKLNNDLKSSENEAIAWQNNAVNLARCSHLHAQVFVIRSVHEFLLNTKLSVSLCQVLEKLFELLAIYWIQDNAGEILLYGKYSPKKLQEINSRIPDLLNVLRPNIVSLVDGFDFCDASLQSVIGSYDGRVYERFYDYLSNLPSNKLEVIIICICL
uniref:Acyl-coenzyme A oxidase n=1 Tax=Strigamia maritima TaxID=126957 RepID=T1IPF5_STRMM